MASAHSSVRIVRSVLLWVAILVQAHGLTQSATTAVAIRARERVGRSAPNRIVTPVNQIVTPIGRQIELSGLRPQAIALSPNGRLLVTSGKSHELVVVNPVSGDVRRRVPLPSEQADKPPPDVVSSHIFAPDRDGQLSYTGLVFSPDGRRLYLANVNGSVKVFAVSGDHDVIGLFSIPLLPANAPGRKEEIPAGLALSRDGKRLYVVCNLSNRLAELDAATGTVIRGWDVGFAPYDVVLVGDKAYVSNWGGRRPDANSVTGPGGQGTRLRVDSVRHIASEGSVTVIDLAANRVRTEVLTGLHASALAVAPGGKHVVVANSASDTLSVIDTKTDDVIETIWAKTNPADLFGASPTALAFDRHGRNLFVCNGTMNAVAVIEFKPGKSRLSGLIPVGWFPGAVVHDNRRDALYVANIKGIASGRQNAKTGRIEYNSHQYHGSLSLFQVPSGRALAQHTRVVMDNCRAPMIDAARLPARPGRVPQPVPDRVGEPSVFRHVVYIIKENRTYDQVLGDVEDGNGDSSLCVFGEPVTPNQHKMAREFVLLDNTYCSGILSADGHQWSDTAFATDYMERSFAGFPRSYPDGMEDDDTDALAYSPAGFIWDNAIAHGKSLRVYGEFAITEAAWKDKTRKSNPRFLDYYHDFVDKTGLIDISSRPAIESLRSYLCANTVGWDMAIPDVFRAARFIEELRQFEQKGEFPNLAIICLPNDHTSGTAAGRPTPAAQVADNDIAFGQIVEAISHSRFWKETCILAIEDDPQAGWDHVSGYRTTAYVISPYTRRHVTVSTQYNQTSLLRTIELILGLPPMNIMDASATPMTDCFTEQPDFAPFVAVPNRVPLDQMNPDPEQVSNPIMRRFARTSARLPLDRVDQCPEDLLNRIIWHSMKGPTAPYPVWAIHTGLEDEN